jgi:hypothetical protein
MFYKKQKPRHQKRGRMISGSSPCGSTSEPVDVAVNIFAKPFQTALSLLSLMRCSGRHVGVIWLQFEPYGSQYDTVSLYLIAKYLREQMGERCQVFQPEYWLDLNAADASRLDDPSYRWGIRYQYAFEHSKSRKLFLMHNDVLIFRDILGGMLAKMGESFAVGALGQCWNCPAGNKALMREAFDCGPCTPQTYTECRLSYEDLCRLYALAREREVFARPYERHFVGIFDRQPWPLPECRVNEWACLLDLAKTQKHCIPFGSLLPPGAYRQCGPVCLDIGVEWFRGLHALGMRAGHFDINPYMKHWVGTGKVTERKYRLAEENALGLLRKHYPEYLQWLGVETATCFLP